MLHSPQPVETSQDSVRYFPLQDRSTIGSVTVCQRIC